MVSAKLAKVSLEKLLAVAAAMRKKKSGMFQVSSICLSFCRLDAHVLLNAWRTQETKQNSGCLLCLGVVSSRLQDSIPYIDVNEQIAF